jgi:hypothetical protein
VCWKGGWGEEGECVGEARVLLEHMLDVRENLEGDTELRLDVAIISVHAGGAGPNLPSWMVTEKGP